MRILVTNDDGIDSIGLHALARALTELGEVVIVAPDREFSGSGASVGALYEFTCQFARLEPAPPETQQLFGAMHGNQEAMDGFARVISGVVSPADFFSEENLGRIFRAKG